LLEQFEFQKSFHVSDYILGDAQGNVVEGEGFSKASENVSRELVT